MTMNLVLRSDDDDSSVDANADDGSEVEADELIMMTGVDADDDDGSRNL